MKVVAVSVDNEASGAALVEKHHLRFPVGPSADADQIAATLGAYTHDEPRYLQSTGFVLAPGRLPKPPRYCERGSANAEESPTTHCPLPDAAVRSAATRSSDSSSNTPRPPDPHNHRYATSG